MDIHRQLTDLREFLVVTFVAVDTWFDLPDALLDYVPANQDWSAAEVLTHISLINHYLLALLERGTIKVQQSQQNSDLTTKLAAQSLLPMWLEPVGVLHGFTWLRPEYLEPRLYPLPLALVRAQLQAQLPWALAHLDQLPDGQGVRHQAVVRFNNLSQRSVYEYLLFMAQHARQHLRQM